MKRKAALFFALLFLFGCRFEAPAPKRTPPPKAPPAPLSTLSARLTISMHDILALLNDKTKPEIAHVTNKKVDCAIAKCHLTLVATRDGDFTGRAENGKIALSLPFKISAHLDFKSKILKTGADTNATGIAQSETSLALAPNWKLEPKTDGKIQLSQAEMKIGPLKMNVADLWNSNEDHLSEPLFKAMDRHIASAVKVREQAKRLWMKVQRPLRVGKSPVAWLLIAPENIRIGTPVMANDNVAISLSVDARAHVVIADDEPQTKALPLPAPAPQAAPSNAFTVTLPVLLPYDEAAALALKRLHDKPPHIGGANVHFEKLQILPSGQDVILQARFCIAQGWDFFGWFDACGTGYLRGVPQFDARTQTIRITHVHYDIATENAILAAMRALAGNELGRDLESKLVFNVSRDIAKLQQDVRTTLAKRPARGVIITGDIQSFGAPTLTWTDQGFLANFTAKGTIAADLNIKPPVKRKKNDEDN